MFEKYYKIVALTDNLRLNYFYSANLHQIFLSHPIK